ncbi:hypothetical protein C8Q78DRAFT_704138 [Trametes maxima]|nr:hypothetical protein C8Q78DRAFT_704138 [Trametes maxima]
MPLVDSATGLVNRTIDDQEGDSVTGALPNYLPKRWNTGQTCSTCNIHPGIIDASQAFDGTWSDMTYSGAGWPDQVVAINFTGSAVYVYNILVNTAIADTDTFTNLTFYIDGEGVGAFSHEPDGTSLAIYNVPVYTNSSMPYGPHSLRMVSTGIKAALALFDYLVYTTEDKPPTSSNPPAPSFSLPISPVGTSTQPSSKSTVASIHGSTVLFSSFPWSSLRQSSQTPVTPSTLRVSTLVQSRTNSSSLFPSLSASRSVTVITTATPVTQGQRSPHTAVIAGGIIGGFAALLIALLTAFKLLLCYRRSRRLPSTMHAYDFSSQTRSPVDAANPLLAIATERPHKFAQIRITPNTSESSIESLRTSMRTVCNGSEDMPPPTQTERHVSVARQYPLVGGQDPEPLRNADGNTYNMNAVNNANSCASRAPGAGVSVVLEALCNEVEALRGALDEQQRVVAGLHRASVPPSYRS